MKRHRPLPSPPSSPTGTPKPHRPKTTVPNSISSYYPSKKPTNPLLSKSPKWVPLNLNKSELYLPLTFPTGQTFRWKQTSPFQFTGVVGSHLISLKQLQDSNQNGVFYCFHNTSNCNQSAAKSALLDFLNMGVCLKDLWNEFSACDPRFADLAAHLSGARVLRQDPLECVVHLFVLLIIILRGLLKWLILCQHWGIMLERLKGLGFMSFRVWIGWRKFRRKSFGRLGLATG